eukprot:NODE_695_length_4670_cov_0.352439.p6 type:complete len:112 gc:universal NODE_695_length_4670_cov_0.352439:123-458(+)
MDLDPFFSFTKTFFESFPKNLSIVTMSSSSLSSSLRPGIVFTTYTLSPICKSIAALLLLHLSTTPFRVFQAASIACSRIAFTFSKSMPLSEHFAKTSAYGVYPTILCLVLL